MSLSPRIERAEGLLFEGEEQVLHLIERIVVPLRLRVDESSPYVDARLQDGSRVNTKFSRAHSPPVCFAEMSDRIDLQALRSTASDLQQKYRAPFHERGGELRVSAGKTRVLPRLGKAIELRASVEWDGTRTYDHIDVEVARASAFSRRSTKTCSPTEALGTIEDQLTSWLGDTG
jgi:type IV secretory pathway ATPase VirB11/archaellum biosynthesis ATPase